jgi:hypothetical protein
VTDASAWIPAGNADSVKGARFLEFLLVGGGTLIFLPLCHLARAYAGADDAELALGFLAFHAAVIVNNPHFAVTYLLFYENAKERAFGSVFKTPQRLRYVLSGFLAPLLLMGWAGNALYTHSAERLGWLLQLMFLLVGWHYVKQGFGVLTVLSARRGVRFDRFERTAVLAHCFAGWLYARTNPRDPGQDSLSDGVFYTSFAQPDGVALVTRVAFALSAAILCWVLARKWRRDGGLPLVPLAGLLITVWLWVVYTRVDPLLVYVIPALHSLQYLYFVWLLRKNRAAREAGPPAFKSATRALVVLAASAIALGWLLFRGAPNLLDGWLVLNDPVDPLGPTPYLAGLGAIVNIHHYLMDAVIWRRENPETALLLA